MQTFNSLLEQELKKLIQDEIESLRDNLEVNTYNEVGQFKYVMGKVAGLKLATELVSQAVKKADQSNR
jgi:hypothetical protein